MVNVRAIKTDADYRAALARVETLWDADEGTTESDELDVLATLIGVFEDERYPTEFPSPAAAIKFRMEQNGLTAKDIAPYIGSRARVSEVLSGKRSLTLAMIRALHENLGIPADVLIKEPGASLPDAIEGIDWSRFPILQMAKHGIVAKRKNLKEHIEEAMRDLIAAAGGMSNAAMALRKKTDATRRNAKMDSYALRAWCLHVLARARAQPLPANYKQGTIDETFLTQVVKLSVREDGPAAARVLLAKHGIALVVARHLPKTYLDGAAMLTPEGRPVIGMTLRHDRIDNFWYCLLHELAHIGRHLGSDTKTAFIDDLDMAAVDNTGAEAEADEWALSCSIPDHAWNALPPQVRPTTYQVCGLAQRIGVSPAIVAGRVRRETGNYKALGDLVGHGEVRKHFPEWAE